MTTETTIVACRAGTVLSEVWMNSFPCPRMAVNIAPDQAIPTIIPRFLTSADIAPAFPSRLGGTEPMMVLTLGELNNPPPMPVMVNEAKMNITPLSF